MRPAPVRRLVAAAGLIALAPVAAMLYQGVLTPLDAAMRAAVVLAVVLVVTRLAGWGLRMVLAAVEGVLPRAASGAPVGAAPAEPSGGAGADGAATSEQREAGGG